MNKRNENMKREKKPKKKKTKIASQPKSDKFRCKRTNVYNIRWR